MDNQRGGVEAVVAAGWETARRALPPGETSEWPTAGWGTASACIGANPRTGLVFGGVLGRRPWLISGFQCKSAYRIWKSWWCKRRKGGEKWEVEVLEKSRCGAACTSASGEGMRTQSAGTAGASARTISTLSGRARMLGAALTGAPNRHARNSMNFVMALQPAGEGAHSPGCALHSQLRRTPCPIACHGGTTSRWLRRWFRESSYDCFRW